MRFVAESMVIWQLRHLIGSGLDETRFIETDGNGPEAGEALDIFLALVVVDIDSLAVIDHDGTLALMRAGIRIGMKHR